MLNKRILDAHKGYAEAKNKLDALYSEQKAVGRQILDKVPGSHEQWSKLEEEISVCERDVNQWARRVADQFTDYINMDERSLIR